MPDAQAPSRLPAPCGSNAEISPIISSSKFGHGGPRPNSGGPRANSGGARPNSGGVRIAAGRPRAIGLAPREIWSGPRWCVYQTHPQAENIAAHELTRAGYRAYAPLIAVLVRDRVLHTMFHKALVSRMPGYGFVELGPGEPWVPIQRSPGVRGLLLTTGNKPALCAPGEVERHLAEDAALCELKRETLPELAEGTVVAVEAGAMAGRCGTVIADDGMVTTLEMLLFGRRISIRMPRAMLATVVPA